MKIVVDCIHNAGRMALSSARRPDTAYSIASSVCKLLNQTKDCTASMPERDCVERFGSDSLRGRISIASSQKPDCYICFHSNPSVRCRENGVAAFVRRGDKKAAQIAEKIMDSIVSSGELKILGIYENPNSAVLSEAAECSPVIMELVFNPYGEGYSLFQKKLEGLPQDVALGLQSAFKTAQEISDTAFQEYLTNNSGTGFLKVQVVAGRSIIPVPEARIVIIKNLDGKEYVVADVTSDMNGMTIPVSLPAPPSQLSQTPENLTPYAVYDVRVSRDGYQAINNLNVPVFDKVVSIQTARLNQAAVNGEDQVNDEAGSQKL